MFNLIKKVSFLGLVFSCFSFSGLADDIDQKNMVAYCYTPNVADAGYQIIVKEEPSKNLQVDIYEMFFHGIEKRNKKPLNCKVTEYFGEYLCQEEYSTSKLKILLSKNAKLLDSESNEEVTDFKLVCMRGNRL